MSKLIKKISAKNVCGAVEQEVIGHDDVKDKPIIGFKQKAIMDVFGIAIGVRTGNTDYGPFMGLRGQFQATNLETGEVFRSSQCFLADDLCDLIASQLSVEGTTSVEFGFRVGITPNDTAIGYEYTAEPLIDAAENDPLDAIAAKIQKQTQPAIEDKTTTTDKPVTTEKPHQQPVSKNTTKPATQKPLKKTA